MRGSRTTVSDAGSWRVRRGVWIDGGEARFARRQVSATDLAWVLMAAEAVKAEGGVLDEPRCEPASLPGRDAEGVDEADRHGVGHRPGRGESGERTPRKAVGYGDLRRWLAPNGPAVVSPSDGPPRFRPSGGSDAGAGHRRYEPRRVSGPRRRRRQRAAPQDGRGANSRSRAPACAPSVVQSVLHGRRSNGQGPPLGCRHIELDQAVDTPQGRVEVVVRSVDEVDKNDGASIIGLFADEPELMDEVSESAMAARERDFLRARGA